MACDAIVAEELMYSYGELVAVDHISLMWLKVKF